MANELQGVAELTAKLNELGVELSGKHMRSAARDAMKIAYDQARAGIPTWSPPENSRGYHLTYKGNPAWPGYAFRNLKLIGSIDKKNGVIRAIIGVSKEAYYAVQFVEFGTSRQPANSWLRNALESTQSSVLHSLASNIRKRVERIVRKKAAGIRRARKAGRTGFRLSESF